MQIFTGKELSNERYHSEEFPQASGSILSEIIESSPAEYFMREKKETKALNDGIAAHACVLEPERFRNTYVRGINPADYPDSLEGNKMLEGWLKDRGIKCSGKIKSELLELIDKTGENPAILQRIIDKHEADSKEKGLEVIDFEVYDMILKMRKMLKQWGYVFTSKMQYEVSLIDDDIKCRIDIIIPPNELAPDGELTINGEIWDYKSTSFIHPDQFGREAVNRNYWLKMAMQADLFERKYGNKPDRVVLLAQSKKGHHYLAQAYQLTSQQLEAGRADYRVALSILHNCQKTGSWYGYGGGVTELQTPGYIAHERGFNDQIEIIED